MGRLSSQTLIAEYQRLQALASTRGDGPGREQTLGWDLEFQSFGSLLGFLDFVLFRGMNDFLSDRSEPLILDCGANVGFTVLNYKRLFPRARMTAFEPDPRFVPVLRRNLQRNGACDVNVVEAAVWTSQGRMPWVTVGTDGSRVVADGSDTGTCEVSTIDLVDYLDQDVDLLKIDIEGAEFDVVPHLAPRLGNVKNVLVECHLSTQTSYAALARVIGTLQAAGFSISLNTYGPWRDLTRRHIPAPWHAEQYVLVAGWRGDAPGLSREATGAPYAGISTELALTRAREVLAATRGQKDRFLADLAQGRSTLDCITLTGPFRRELGHCWTIACEERIPDGDGGTSQDSSILVLEDDQPMGPAHVLHDDIRGVGRGRYSHWGRQLYLSASDNSDPNHNGRVYRVVCQRTVTP
jgi:FkbM family methyltransferase